MTIRAGVMIAMLLAILGVAAPAALQESTALAYDDFMKKPVEERLRLFDRVTPANKAELMSTHGRRWLEAHRPSLEAEQVRVLEDMILLLTPDLYEGPKTTEREKAVNEMGARIVRHFTFEEAAQFSGLGGDYIPAAPR